MTPLNWAKPLRVPDVNAHKAIHAMRTLFAGLWLAAAFGVKILWAFHPFSRCLPHGKSLLCALLALLLLPVPALAEDDLAGAEATKGPAEQAAPAKKHKARTGYAFFDDATIEGGVYSMYRNRVRYNLESRRYAANLDHLSMQTGLAFVSGYAGGLLGLDVGIYATADLRQRAGVDHEMNFFPWSNPYRPRWDKSSTENGVSFYKANLKLKTDPFWAKAGYFQPSGPGVLGVNWSFFPGTYRGLEAGATWGRFELAAAFADKYKAPWFLEPYGFRKQDKESSIPWLGSLGLRYTFTQGLRAELAYGSSKDFLHNAHIKLDQSLNLEGAKLHFGYHLYGMQDSSSHKDNPNNVFDGTAVQQYLYIRHEQGLWTLRLEGTLTSAPQASKDQTGYFAYRLTTPSGSSKGAYTPWWDARSDWNADGEKAVFAGISRELDDLLPISGFSAGLGYAFGFDGKAYGTARHLKESAWTADVGYLHKKKGLLEGAWIKAHYTHYTNRTNLPSWEPFKNAFQNERDIKILAGIPFAL